jgi:hypothetical protein
VVPVMTMGVMPSPTLPQPSSSSFSSNARTLFVLVAVVVAVSRHGDIREAWALQHRGHCCVSLCCCQGLPSTRCAPHFAPAGLTALSVAVVLTAATACFALALTPHSYCCCCCCAGSNRTDLTLLGAGDHRPPLHVGEPAPPFHVAVTAT